MSVMYGANSDELERIAGQIRSVADDLDSEAAMLTGVLNRVSWLGDVATRFLGQWTGVQVPKIGLSTQFLRDAAVRLEHNARQQRHTSNTNAGGLRTTPQSPGDVEIPDAPPPPPSDPGAGVHGSQPWYATPDDVIFYEVARSAADAADVIGYDDAADHLRHYLANSGDPYEVNPERIAGDVPAFKSHIESQLQQAVESQIAEAVASGEYGVPIPFETKWSGFYLTKDLSENWFYALGGVNTAVTGVVVVHPGDPPTATVDYQYHLSDRYNWDGGKSTKIGPITITDEKMGELHTAGLAKEYDVYGSSETHSTTITHGGAQPSVGSVESRDGRFDSPRTSGSVGRTT